MSVSDACRQRVAAAAGYRCGYCRISQNLLSIALTIEHILPLKLGGTDDEYNLWLSCVTCNGFKRAQHRVRDPQTGRLVVLFNPRRQKWPRHFQWTDGGLRIRGRTAVGRATVVALKLNDDIHVTARRFWIDAGVWPPEEA
jgi:hypothetical protein